MNKDGQIRTIINGLQQILIHNSHVYLITLELQKWQDGPSCPPCTNVVCLIQLWDVVMSSLKAASHCPETDSRWTPKYEILKFLSNFNFILHLFLPFFLYFSFLYFFIYISLFISSQLRDCMTPALMPWYIDRRIQQLYFDVKMHIHYHICEKYGFRVVNL